MAQKPRSTENVLFWFDNKTRIKVPTLVKIINGPIPINFIELPRKKKSRTRKASAK